MGLQLLVLLELMPFEVGLIPAVGLTPDGLTAEFFFSWSSPQLEWIEKVCFHQYLEIALYQSHIFLV